MSLSSSVPRDSATPLPGTIQPALTRLAGSITQARVPELDGIRGCAILLVLVWHYIACQLHAVPGTAAAYVERSLSMTWSGVDLFFVLSGFLISGILLDNRPATNYFRVFYARRICRIFPLYFLVLGLFMFFLALGAEHWSKLSWLFHSPLPLWSYATFTQNVLMASRQTMGSGWLEVTWSLAVEEQFYLVIPLLIWLLPRRQLAVVAVLLVFLAPLLRSTWGSWFQGYLLTPWRGDSLLTGTLLAIAVRNQAVLSLLRANIPALYAVFFCLLAGVVVMSIRPGGFGGPGPYGAATQTWLAGRLLIRGPWSPGCCATASSCGLVLPRMESICTT
jgi:peptidoglycan/LPS O-acetylase OafA/YrhL